MADRFILLHESILDWEWYNDLYVYKLFTTMILLASYKDTSYKGITLKRGSFITSIKSLGEKTHLSATCIKRCLEKLVSTGDITDDVQPNKYRIITIVNYDKYQSVGFPKTNNKTNSKTNCKTNNKTTFNKDIDTPKGVSISQGKKNKKSSVPARPDGGSHDVKCTVPDILEFLQFANTVDTEQAEVFYSAFQISDTAMPDKWQELYKRFCQSSDDKRQDFLDRLLNGDYKEKWGEHFYGI